MIRPTILWALGLAMLGGALFACAYLVSLRPPAGRAYPGAFRRLLAWWGVRSAAAPASRLGVGEGRPRSHDRPLPLTSGEGAGHGLTHRAPSPVSYAAGLRALARTTDRVSQSMTGASRQQPVASRPHAAGLRPHP